MLSRLKCLLIPAVHQANDEHTHDNDSTEPQEEENKDAMTSSAALEKRTPSPESTDCELDKQSEVTNSVVPQGYDEKTHICNNDQQRTGTSEHGSGTKWTQLGIALLEKSRDTASLSSTVTTGSVRSSIRAAKKYADTVPSLPNCDTWFEQERRKLYDSYYVNPQPKKKVEPMRLSDKSTYSIQQVVQMLDYIDKNAVDGINSMKEDQYNEILRALKVHILMSIKKGCFPSPSDMQVIRLFASLKCSVNWKYKALDMNRLLSFVEADWPLNFVIEQLYLLTAYARAIAQNDSSRFHGWEFIVLKGPGCIFNDAIVDRLMFVFELLGYKLSSYGCAVYSGFTSSEEGSPQLNEMAIVELVLATEELQLLFQCSHPMLTVMKEDNTATTSFEQRKTMQRTGSSRVAARPMQHWSSSSFAAGVPPVPTSDPPNLESDYEEIGFPGQSYTNASFQRRMAAAERSDAPGNRRDGQHCDLCGSTAPIVRCAECNQQIFCLSCDDAYHRHPKRKTHLRKALDTHFHSMRPPLPPKGDHQPPPVPPPRKHKRVVLKTSPLFGRRELPEQYDTDSMQLSSLLAVATNMRQEENDISNLTTVDNAQKKREDAHKHEAMKAQGMELVRLLREAEQHSFSADDLQIALSHCGEKNPILWLQDNLKNMLDTVVILATNYGHERKVNDIGTISTTEARDALRIHKGNVWAAVTECVEQRLKKYAELSSRGAYTREDVVTALTVNHGNVEAAYLELSKSQLKPFLMRIYGPPSGPDSESGNASVEAMPPPQSIPAKQAVATEEDDHTEFVDARSELESPMEGAAMPAETGKKPVAAEQGIAPFLDSTNPANKPQLSIPKNEDQPVQPAEQKVCGAIDVPHLQAGNTDKDCKDDAETPDTDDTTAACETQIEVYTSQIEGNEQQSCSTPLEAIETVVELIEKAVEEVFATANEVQQEKKEIIVQQMPEKTAASEKFQFERLVRRYLAESKVCTYEMGELAVQLIQLNFDETDALTAAHECGTLDSAISYLQQECELCATKFTMKQMVSMLRCTHHCCRECASQHFTVVIRDRNIVNAVCPFCEEPNLEDEDDDAVSDYFSHLDILLKSLVSGDIHELFQRKLRDRTLMRDPNFKWCSQCSSGFIADPNQKRLMCPDCKAITCAQCRKPWEDQHEGISCEQFSLWKEENDPEVQAAGLARHLSEHGIDCPRCRFRYALAKGGCMHFTCTQCKFEFCSGCGKPFRMGVQCSFKIPLCAKMGLHAHHPRNCLFYLRDKDPENLQQLLQEHCIKFDTGSPGEEEGSDDSNGDWDSEEDDDDAPEAQQVPAAVAVAIVRCKVQIQKETPVGLEDTICGNTVEQGHAGLCKMHYIEYLGNLIRKYQLDPVSILSNEDLETILKRSNKHVPAHQNMTEAKYRELLLRVIAEEIPLE